MKKATKANLIERQLYFLLYNSNEALYKVVKDYVGIFNKRSLANIESKVIFSSTMSLICIAVVGLCGLTILPFMTKIIHRSV